MRLCTRACVVFTEEPACGLTAIGSRDVVTTVGEAVVSKRPCVVCRRWFLPHPRAGGRQRVCSTAECQRERHRRACQTWHERQRDEDARDRVTKAIELTTTEYAPGDRVRWIGVRDAVSVELCAVLALFAKVLERQWRDAVSREVAENMRKSREDPRRHLRDDIGPRSPGT